jgi:hypothetical protein
VPGYDRGCPYGTLLQTFRNIIYLSTSERPIAKLRFRTVERCRQRTSRIENENDDEDDWLPRASLP